ncbi:alpha/beta fold hydrolase [Bacillus dakarensis]|uniref:alpha/beta fold hydrolase n=1 Tax=Robertmurraya dakarensis TaxID=1926278 RepID=UPI001F3C0813|nr:alpha/beta hydrolase [Bacillus dakarensis]
MNKETIIFLHGIVGNKNAFKKEMEQLEAHYHCISYNYYYLEDELADLSLEALVEQLYTVFIQNKVKKAHLCALSFGSVVVKAFARKYPEMVATMTLVGGYLCSVPSQWNYHMKKVLEDNRKYDTSNWVRRCAKLLNPNSEHLPEDSEMIFEKFALQVHPEVLVKAFQIQYQFDSKAALSGLETPILWVMGEYDELHKGTLAELKQLVPHVEYNELFHAGHAAHAHQHELFMYLFHDFLKRNPVDWLERKVQLSV